MNERSLILMGGAPGSGTTRLGKSIRQHLLRSHMSVEHLSVGNRVRDIGAGVVRSVFRDEVIKHLNASSVHKPMDDEIAYGVVNEALFHYGDLQTVLLDGYPRYVTQVDYTEELARKEERAIHGMIVTDVDDETSLARMIKRGQKMHDRSLTTAEAVDRLAEHTAYFPQVLTELTARDIPIERIDTSGSKETTDELGLRAVQSFFNKT